MSKAIGIDFGTSNSTVGFVREGKPGLIALEEGKPAIPSAIFFDTEERRTLFGRSAVAAYVDHCEGRLLRALKSILGSALIDDTTQVGGRRLSFKSIIGEFLGHIKATTERQLGREVDCVVLGRPVWFVDGNEAADLAAQEQLEFAARACGFKEILFQYEPIAAALDYEQHVMREELALIVDIGGGTSDFSIVRVSPERRGQQDRKQDVLANAGVHIGGTDLDRKLSVCQVMPLLGYRTHLRDKPTVELPASPFFELATWHQIAFLYNNKTVSRLKDLRAMAERPELVERMIKVIQDRNGHRLAGDVETAKMALSLQDRIELTLGYVDAGLQTLVTKKQFEAAIANETTKISQQIHECLHQAQISAADIHTLFMTGGTTAVPAIFAACKNALPHARLVAGDMMGSVGTGLALYAAARFGK